MPKNVGARTGGPSRVRFIMLDAELNDGDLSQITQAIQNALTQGGKSPPARLVAVSPQAPKANGGQTGTASEAQDPPPEESEEEIEAQGDEISGSSRARAPRKVRSPKVLDLDLTSDVSLESFVQSKKTDNDTARNLVIAAWFKQHRNMDAITVDHVYTCYRALKWPTAIADFAKPLKNLKQRQLFDGKDGAYAINHLGIARVEKPDG